MKTASALAICALVILTLGQACGPAFTPMSDENSSLSSSSFLSEAERTECAATGPKPTITSISTLVDYLNALPRPVKLHCMIAQLPRPLYVQGGASAASAQPSPDPSNPRIFIKLPTMILAVVPDGTAKNTLEIGEYKTSTMLDRAEFLFPITTPTLTASEGLDHINPSGASTTCKFCHQTEQISGTLNGSTVFRSNLLKFASADRIPVSTLKREAELCRDRGDSSDRCLLFKALFDLGSVYPTEL